MLHAWLLRTNHRKRVKIPRGSWGPTTKKSLSLDRTFCGKGQANLAMGGLPLDLAAYYLGFG